MTETIAAIIWVASIVLSLVIRFPHQRRARKQATMMDDEDAADWFFLVGAQLGLIVIPFVYVATGFPALADHEFRPWMGWIGLVVEVGFAWLFFRSHRELGKNWSITLEIRDQHRLVTDGLYRYVRHPMYAAFWLWAIAQAFLIPNWFAGLAGLAGIAGLYFSRVGKEERVMERTFGEEYRSYCARTGRIVPKLFG